MLKNEFNMFHLQNLLFLSYITIYVYLYLKQIVESAKQVSESNLLCITSVCHVTSLLC